MRHYKLKSGNFIVFIYRIVFLITCLSITSFSWSQKPDLPNALLWEITGNNLKLPSYIFGTIHLRDKTVFQFNDSLLSRLKTCEVYAPEMDLAPEKITPLYSKLILPGDSTLNDIFTPDEYKLIGEVLKNKTGMDISVFNKMRPVVLLMMVMNSQLPSNEKFTLDEYLYRQATAMHKRISGIEKPDEQFDLLGKISKEDILNFFRHPDEKKDYTKMINFYKQGKLDSLLVEIQNDSTGFDFQNSFITSRNYRMAARIDTLIRSRSAFIAIGAGHLPGSEGVLNLLEEKGYKIKPVFIISAADAGNNQNH